MGQTPGPGMGAAAAAGDGEQEGEEGEESRGLGVLDTGELLEIYAAILQSAPDAMVVVDTNGRIRFLNEQTLRLFDYERDALLGKSVELLVPERFRDKHPAHRDHYVKNPHFRAMGAGLELYGRKSDGSEFPVEISLSPIRFKDHLYVAAAIRDATERKVAQEAKRLATKRGERIRRLEQEKRFKAQLLNMVSHELNTPLTPLKLQLHLLRKRLEDGDGHAADKSLEVLERNFQRLARLIGDVLDVSRLEAGRLRIATRDVDLHEVLEHTKESFETAGGDGPGVRIHLEPAEGDLDIQADPDRLQQVFDNLVANAVRLSPDRSTVTISVHRNDGDVLVRVSDEGPGLTGDQIRKLFLPFSQVHDRRQDRGGTGLGLFVSKGIVEAHGGTIHADSPGPGKGAVFTVTLPLQETRGPGPHGQRDRHPDPEALGFQRAEPKRGAAQGEHGPTLE